MNMKLILIKLLRVSLTDTTENKLWLIMSTENGAQEESQNLVYCLKYKLILIGSHSHAIYDFRVI